MSDSALKQLREEIDQVVKELLPPDSSKWCKDIGTRPKIIHDSLWGTFQLKPHEVAIIDTALLQRLRFIHQTGAVYLTYPSALHTRFEHTLGVLHQAGRMCAILRERRGNGLFGAETENNARVAALLHDTGHGPFSHTSEQYFSAMPQIAAAKKLPEFAQSGAGEILSSLIIASRPFREFVRALNSHFRTTIDCDAVRSMITGSVPPDKLFLSEIVHGPIDADKLDYMHRDGMFSGLKMHVDLDRLYASIDVHTDDDDADKTTRIVGTISGTSPLTQIMFNKMLLFTGIYHHHKVRAVDCMLWAIFDLAVTRGKKIGGQAITSPVDFLRITDDRMLIPEMTDDSDIAGLITAIRNRRLWQRALMISRRTVSEEMLDTTADAGGAFNDFVALKGNHPSKIKERRRISDKIWKTAGEPCQKHEVWLDVPQLPSMDEAAKTWILAPGQKRPATLGEFIPVGQWVELYGTHKWRSHVFCPRAVREEIATAAEKVLKGEFGLHLLPSAKHYSEAS